MAKRGRTVMTPLIGPGDALVSERGRTAATRALGVNYRTMMACYDSRRVSWRMCQALVGLRDAQNAGDDGPA